MARRNRPVSAPVGMTRPRKQVKFLIPSESRSPICLTPILGTPSPAWSQTSLPSTGGPRTPPIHTVPLPPYAFPPMKENPVAPRFPRPRLSLEMQTSVPPSLYSYLAYPQVRLDIAFPPPPYRSRIPSYLVTSATNPPSQVMTVVVPGLPWSIIVKPRTSFPFVTVLDILDALHTSLRKPIKQVEFDAVSHQYRKFIAAAWHGRLDKMSPSDARAEWARGVRRIDFLLGNTCIQRFGYHGISDRRGLVWLAHFGT